MPCTMIVHHDWGGSAVFQSQLTRSNPGGFAQSLYGDLLWGLLLLTMVPILWTLVHKSPLEHTQALLNEMAKVDLTGKDSNTKNGLKRKALQAGRERPWPLHPAPLQAVY